MNARTLPLILTVVALVITAGTAVAVVTGSPDIGVSLSDNRFAPGDEVTLEVVLSNSGDLDSASAQNPSLNSEVTTARGLSADLNSGDAPISVTTPRRSLGSLGTGSPTTVTFQVSIDDDAEPGNYDVPVVLRYEYYSYISETEGVREEESRTDRESVNLRVTDDATFDVVNVSSNARVDSTGTVAVTVENTGETAANDSVVTLNSPGQTLTVDGQAQSTRYAGSWEPGEERTFQFNVGATENAEPEPYDFTLDVAFDNTDGVRKTDDGNRVGIAPDPERSFSLTDVESTLRAGEDGTLEATLTNTGPGTVDNLVLNWDSDHSNLSPQESQYAVGALESGESTTVSFDVDASDNARAGPRQFDFVAGYQNDDGDTKQSDPIQVQASVAESQDEFTLDPANTTVTVGETSTIDITITNTRAVPLTDISAQLFADSPISAEDDEGYVGALGPGESTTLTFSVSTEGSALQKSYPLSLDFQYEEPDGDTPVSDTYRVGIDVTEPGGGGGLPVLAVGAVLVVLLLAVGGYLRFR